MTIDSVTAIYFSPTGTTKKTVQAIAIGTGIKNIRTVDITSFQVRHASAPPIEDDMVIIGVPVYEEELPGLLIPFLESLKGRGKLAVVAAVYGNIGAGTALNDLWDIAQSAGFIVIGAGLFIGEHSFSAKERPVAQGRPDADDLQAAEEFGASLIKKLQTMNDLSGASLSIPKGKKLLMAKILPPGSARIFTKTPNADMQLCNRCGVCANLCPMGAIDKSTLAIDEKLCLRCFCCVKKCPQKARSIVYRMKFPAPQVLTAQSRIRREPKIYL